GRRARGRAEQRIQKDQPDQHTPKAAAHGACAREIHDLVELRLALPVSRDDYGVLHLDEVFLLHLQQRVAHVEGGRLVVEDYCYKRAHLHLPYAESRRRWTFKLLAGSAAR